MKYKDFSVKSNSIFSLFQTEKIRFSNIHCLGLFFFLEIDFWVKTIAKGFKT